jgi:hypothetical protein
VGLNHCIFCDVLLAASQMDLPSSSTREHVFARWYRDVVVNKSIKMFTATMGKPPLLHRQPPLEELVNKKVCKDCNSGWMSALEVAIEPVVQRLVDGEDVRKLSPSDIELSTFLQHGGHHVLEQFV